MTHPQQEAFDAVVPELLRADWDAHKAKGPYDDIETRYHVLTLARRLGAAAERLGLDTSIIDKTLAEIAGG